MRCDAIVVGGGPAGSMAALLLARAGWSVAVVEKSAFPRRKVCGEFISAPVIALLERAGIAAEVFADAGPEVREIALYAGERVVTRKLPAHAGEVAYARALGREHLDTRLLCAAERAGAVVLQPWRVESATRDDSQFRVSLRGAAERRNPDTIELRAPIVIAAHGSWDTGRLPVGGHASDFVAFKAHFTNCNLPPHRMPLVTFPGGYAGLLAIDAGRASFACCIRRDALAGCRANAPSASAGEAVFAHVLARTPALRELLGTAVRESAWLAAGPLRPGIHGRCGDGSFTIGNAHGEAHPVVGEGISMAIESACLLADGLIATGRPATLEALNSVAREYEGAYRRMFRRRILAASTFAALATRGPAAGAMVRIFDKLPPLFSFCARWAGKTATFPPDLDAMQTASSSR